MGKHLPGAARYMRDISDYQPTFEPVRVRRAGSLAIMIKRAEGIAMGGAVKGTQRAIMAKHAGLRVVNYQLLHTDSSGREQADYLLDVVAPDFRSGDRLLADIEDAGGFQSRAEVEGILHEWGERLHSRGHTSPLGYTDRDYQYMPAPSLLSGWVIADYGTLRRPLGWTTFESTTTSRPSPFPLLGRQFTNGQNGARPHTCPGISGPVDCTWLTDAGVRTILQRQP